MWIIFVPKLIDNDLRQSYPNIHINQKPDYIQYHWKANQYLWRTKKIKSPISVNFILPWSQHAENKKTNYNKKILFLEKPTKQLYPGEDFDNRTWIERANIQNDDQLLPHVRHITVTANQGNLFQALKTGCFVQVHNPKPQKIIWQVFTMSKKPPP